MQKLYDLERHKMAMDAVKSDTVRSWLYNKLENHITQYGMPNVINSEGLNCIGNEYVKFLLQLIETKQNEILSDFQIKK